MMRYAIIGLFLPVLAITSSISSRGHAPGTMKVKVVDCKGQSEGKTCYDLCFNKRHVVVRIDNESGEGKIVGEKDSHIFADYDQESGDIIVYVQSKKLKCGLWAGNAKDMTLKCTDGQSKHNPTEIKAEDGIATRSIGRIGPLHVIERTDLDRRTPAIAALMPRAFDPKGYRVNVVIMYDDKFLKTEGKGDPKKAAKEVQMMVRLMNQMFKHKTLDIKIKLDVMAIENAKGQEWTGDSAPPYQEVCGKLAKAHKIQNANSYICIGGRPKTHEAGGIAGKGTVCQKMVDGRVTFVQQVTMSGQTGELLSTAASKVVTAEIITHEIGHQLGMGHDFVGMDSTNLKTGPDGKKCSGFMDYNETTDQWSKCSNADMKKFLNSLKKNCLMPQGTTGASTHWEEKKPEVPVNDSGECKPPLCIAGP